MASLKLINQIEISEESRAKLISDLIFTLFAIIVVIATSILVGLDGDVLPAGTIFGTVIGFIAGRSGAYFSRNNVPPVAGNRSLTPSTGGTPNELD